MKHYAGDVTYASVGFERRTKTRAPRPLRRDARVAIGLCAHALPRRQRGGEPGEGRATRGGKKGKKNSADKMTVGSQFMQQLAS